MKNGVIQTSTPIKAVKKSIRRASTPRNNKGICKISPSISKHSNLPNNKYRKLIYLIMKFNLSSNSILCRKGFEINFVLFNFNTFSFLY